jgi:transketolase
LGDKAADIIAGLKKLVNEETLVRPELTKIVAKVSEIKKDKEIKLSPPNYDGKKEIATRLAHGTALEKLGKACEYVIVLDGDTKNSTYSIKFHVREVFISNDNRLVYYIGCISKTFC